MSLPVGSEIRVFAPATVANLGPGFAILGLALLEPGDLVVARLVTEPGIRLAAVRNDGGTLSRELTANTVSIAAAEVLVMSAMKFGIELELDKGVPISSGLGSSAASAAAGALAVNLLLGSPLRKLDLIKACLEAESVVSGRHSENAAAALLGGLVLVRSVDPLDVVRLPVIDDLTVVVVTPAFELTTKKARAVLPTDVSLQAMVRNSANLGSLVAALHSGDLGLLSRTIDDRVVTPARAELIPGCSEVFKAAVDSGALGSTISGAGPSVVALCRSVRSAQEVATAMQAAFVDAAGLRSGFVISSADCPGARKL